MDIVATTTSSAFATEAETIIMIPGFTFAADAHWLLVLAILPPVHSTVDPARLPAVEVAASLSRLALVHSALHALP